MTKESPVPQTTLDRYLDESDPARIVVSTKVDGLPQRMIRNGLLDDLEKSSALRLLYYAVTNALAFRRETRASIFGLVRSAIALSTKDSLTIAQTMMSANAPMMLEQSLVAGNPEKGLLPAGQVAAAIDELLSCEELITQIVAQAKERLA